MARKYWLMKTEPGAFSIDDLAASPNQTTPWDGVRNYQARNFMRDEMRLGDRVLFYHSVKSPGIVGEAEVVRESYPDFTAWDPEDSHFDPRSTPEKPLWFMVDIRLVQIFSAPLPLKYLRTVSGLEGMELLRKGSRLSVQPVREEEYTRILELVRDMG
ncbi:EVE domain-containing protein [Desulfobaculum bizertense]|uniref:Predicted RNA-binding protein, contains PUA-like domain n=1 Tax=Desulfobaculum bizertense DSM 18034 TaxID=1121442 RepID=A0A1T4VE17_9BACT|nr:EVE domain-containing protein [Desulfobaculum bizertense]UIJ37635.1 EVE domain-containing protein [Desulfobaculum bizertense]SKA63146.1 Predicted RNA-binding protein, contains PUA-like domain [Desulfobaculum bizertense DSM 18034]